MCTYVLYVYICVIYMCTHIYTHYICSISPLREIKALVSQKLRYLFPHFFNNKHVIFDLASLVNP